MCWAFMHNHQKGQRQAWRLFLTSFNCGLGQSGGTYEQIEYQSVLVLSIQASGRSWWWRGTSSFSMTTMVSPEQDEDTGTNSLIHVIICL